MEAFAANLIYRTTLSTLQCRFLLIPLVKRSRGICCSSEGTSNPSFPVRYVPKTSTKTGKSQTRSKPIKVSDKKVIKKGLDPNAVRFQVLNKRTVSQNSSALDMTPQSKHQGFINGLPNGSYQESKIDHEVETVEDELEEDAEELEIQPGKFPSSHGLWNCKDKEDAAIRLLTTSDKAGDSSNSIQYASKTSPELENGHTRRPSVMGFDVKVMKKSLDPNVARFEIANGRVVSQNIFSDTELQNSTRGPASSFTCFHEGANNKMEYDVETMDDECMEESEDNEKELGINPGNCSLSQDLRACENKAEAEKMAIKLLATRAFTAVELRKKLHGRRFPTSTIDAVITDFQSRGLINDGLYAESFARSRWSSSSWGPRRVKQALLKKGVTEVVAEEALKLVYEDGDQDSSLGLSKVSMDQLYTQASKQWLRGKDISNETRKSRIIRWLQYRGFSWGVTCFILKKLESKHPL